MTARNLGPDRLPLDPSEPYTHADPGESARSSRVRKVYLGDGAYAEFDGYGLALTAENGIAVTNRVYLEPEVYRALTQFVESLKPASTDAIGGFTT